MTNAVYIGKMDFDTLLRRGRLTVTLYNEPVGAESNEVMLVPALSQAAAEPIHGLVFDAAMPDEVAKWLSAHPPLNMKPLQAGAEPAIPSEAVTALIRCINGGLAMGWIDRDEVELIGSRLGVDLAQCVATTQAAPAVAPAGMVLVPVEFLRGFYALAHNYSMKAEAPDVYYGVERDAFSAAYSRCGRDLSKLKDMIAAAPAMPQEAVQDEGEDLQTRLDLHLSWQADDKRRMDLLEQHLRWVLEIAQTWEPDYATAMDRATLRNARECLTPDGSTLAPPPASEQVALTGWQPIETAPKDGRTLLLGYLNIANKWRTVRGQWMSEDEIAENWEDPDDGEPGWYETVVESEDTPNCWLIRPTHWMPLPAAPLVAKEG